MVQQNLKVSTDEAEKLRIKNEKLKESLKIAEAYKNWLLKATLEEDTLSDTTCTVCYKECYDISSGKRNAATSPALEQQTKLPSDIIIDL